MESQIRPALVTKLREDLGTPVHLLRRHDRHAWIRRSLVGLAVLAMLLALLVALRLVGTRVGGTAFGIGVLVAVLPVPLYAAAILFIDRYEPDPPKLEAFAFLYGASVAALLAFLVNTFIVQVVNAHMGIEAAEVYGRSISAPVVEESAKAAVLIFLFLRFRDDFDGILDGVVFAGLVALGFATTENVLYYGRGALEDGLPGALGVFVTRGVLSPFMHPLFTAMFGIGLGIASQRHTHISRFGAAALGLAGAIALHSVWNTSVGAGLFLGVYFTLMIPVFFGLILVIVSSLGREGKIVSERLKPEVDSGLIAPAELETLASVSARMRALHAARRRGRDQYRAQRDWQRTASELALLRHRVSIGRHDDRRYGSAEDLEEAYLTRLRALRPQLDEAASREGPRPSASPEYEHP